jgi:hypothetical protein
MLVKLTTPKLMDLGMPLGATSSECMHNNSNTCRYLYFLVFHPNAYGACMRSAIRVIATSNGPPRWPGKTMAIEVSTSATLTSNYPTTQPLAIL